MANRTNLTTLRVISVFLVVLAVSATVAGGTIYVDADATGANDGSRWADAFNYLQDALAVASSSDEIWVAQGIYKPDEGVGITPGDREATFQLKNGVAVKGGYAGFGQPEPNARDIDAYETILSGDLLGNDGPDFANNSENSYHVVTGSWTDETAVLDGFTITAGNASYSVPPHNNGGGMYNDSGSPTVTNCTFSINSAFDLGGGMSNVSSSPTLTDCTFSENSASYSGGGMFNIYSSPVLANCIFKRNSAYYGGGGMTNSASSPTVTNCTFSANTTSRFGDGGGMVNYKGTPTVMGCIFSGNSARDGGGIYNRESSLTMANCMFSRNSAGDDGGGMWNWNNSPTLTNCTFSGNSASEEGGGMSNYWKCSPTLTNCILWGNTAPIGSQIHNDERSSATVSYSDVQGVWPGIGNINADPLFVDPAIGDYHLLPGSPCIDAGDNSAVPPSVVTDLDGNPRIINGTVDMGAYESSYQGFLLSVESVIVPEGGTATFTVMLAVDPLETVEVSVAVESGDPDITVESGGLLTFDSTNYTQPQTVTLAAAEDADELHGATVILVSAPGVYPASVTAYELDSEAPTELYVDCDALGANNGSSWEDAFTELREPLSFAAGTFFGEIRVAQGIYTPGDREATFQLKNGVAIKGGYAGFGESDPNARDIEVYETVLSGDLLGNDGPGFANNGDNCYHVVTGSGTDETAVLDGFTISGGHAELDPRNGSGMVNIAGSPTLTNCTFTNNSPTDGYGGGMYNEQSSPALTNCTFSGNSAGPNGAGGGMYNAKGSTPILTDCTFSGNSAYGGGGMCNSDSHPILNNCTFSGNTVIGQGGGVYNRNHSSPELSNCTFADNSAKTGGGMRNSNSSNPVLIDCTFTGNSVEGTFSGGGGMYNWGSSTPMLTNCVFSVNSASYYGGGMYNRLNSSPMLTNCTFINNSAPNGGGMYNFDNSSPTVTNCTFSGNSASESGGGMYNKSSSSATLTNCILWGNAAPSDPQIYNDETSSVTVSYSDVVGGWPGEGNIDANPLFGTPGSLELIIEDMGMVSYWKFDEGGGTTAYDSAGDNDGTVYGAQWTIGQLGGALDFGGAGDYVGCGNDSSLNPTNNFSVSAWFKVDSACLIGTIVCKGDVPAYQSGGAYTILCVPMNGTLGFYVRDSSNAGFGYAVTAVSVNEWTHVVGTFSDGNISIYKNGVFAANGVLGTSTINTNNGSLGIGAEGDGGTPFNGIIDDVAIHNRALSSEEIQQLYENGLTGLVDYHLLPDSPCINAGDPNYVAEPNETDLDGKPRVIGGRIDMGAYEFNHIPIADAGPNQTVEAEGAFGARVTLDGSGSSDADSAPGTNDDIVCFDWYKVDACDPNFEDFLGSGEVIDCNLPLGEHIIVLEAIDKAGAFDTNEVTVIVQDTTPPVITLNGPATMTLECGVDSYTEPGATATDICDGNVPVVIGGDVVDTSTCRTYVVTYDATDASGNAAEQVTRTVIVQDTIPPEFTLSVTPTTLWPVNHKMVLITPTRTVSDICDESPEVTLVSITMNEGDEAKGDGHTASDIQIDDDGSIYLRAERSGTRSGRIYTITYQAVDDSGNAAVARATVTVPHDQR